VATRAIGRCHGTKEKKHYRQEKPEEKEFGWGEREGKTFLLVKKGKKNEK